MGLPGPKEARLYYRAAKQRFDDAELLLRAGRTTGAVYLAGYTVECLLKALILASVARRPRAELLGTIRHIGHNIQELGALYRRHGKAPIPRDVTRHLTRVAAWSTDLRYAGGTLRRREVDEFMESVIAVTQWADARM